MADAISIYKVCRIRRILDFSTGIKCERHDSQREKLGYF